MAEHIVNNFSEACKRYEKHRELKAHSKEFYKHLTIAESRFIKKWKSADYVGMSLDEIQRAWHALFIKAPRLSQEHVLFRAVAGQHAAMLAELPINATVDIDRYSSFAHSADMVRKYAAFLAKPRPRSRSRSTITIMCVRIPRGTPFVFLSGLDKVHADWVCDASNGLEDIDRTQGELVLPPMRLLKTAKNQHAQMCEGVFTKKHDRTCNVAITTLCCEGIAST